MPSDREKWDDYFQQTYDTALSLLLDKLESLYDKEHSDKKKRRIIKVVDLYLTKLRKMLSSSSMTQEDISEGLAPCNSHIISVIRSALKRIAE